MERGKRLLNLKDLLTVLPPSLKRSFENGPILTPLFLCRIVPNSAIFCQNLAEYGIKLTFFRDRFYENGPSPAAPGAIPTSAETNWRSGRKRHQSAPHLFAGRRSPDFTSGSPDGYRYGKT